MYLTYLLPLLSVSVLTSASPSPPYPIIKRGDYTDTTKKCNFRLQLWQLCTSNGTAYQVETFADFCDLKDGSGKAISNIKGDGVFGPQTVYTVNHDGRQVGEVFGDDKFYLEWKYYDWADNSTGKTQFHEKMTFAYQAPGSTNMTAFYSDDQGQQACQRGKWDKDDGDINLWYNSCEKQGKDNFLKSRTRVAYCSFDCAQ